MRELYSSIVELLGLKFNVNKEIRQILSSKFKLEVTVFSEYIRKYATEEALKEQEEISSSSDSSISDFSEDEAQDMEL